jgi:hypothetical protein
MPESFTVNNFDLFFQGKINNTGTIALTGNSCVIMNQPSTLTGSGKLTMASTTCIFGAGIPFINQSTIQGAGSIGDSNPMPITNAGTIIANLSSPLVIQPDASGFTNTGVLIANAGRTLNIHGLFNNLNNGTLTGGTYTVSGTLGLQNSVATNAANISLSGAAAQMLNTTTATNALSTLAANSATGVLTLQNGQILTTATNLSNAGKVTIGTASGFHAAGSYTQTAGTTTVDGTLTTGIAGLTLQKGVLQGKGTLAATVNSSATLIAGDSTSTAWAQILSLGKRFVGI